MKAEKKIIAFGALQSSEEPPLCIDLDDTLVKTDTLLESMLLLLKENPAYVLLMASWLLYRLRAFSNWRQNPKLQPGARLRREMPPESK